MPRTVNGTCLDAVAARAVAPMNDAPRLRSLSLHALAPAVQRQRQGGHARTGRHASSMPPSITPASNVVETRSCLAVNGRDALAAGRAIRLTTGQGVHDSRQRRRSADLAHARSQFRQCRRAAGASSRSLESPATPGGTYTAQLTWPPAIAGSQSVRHVEH